MSRLLPLTPSSPELSDRAAWATLSPQQAAFLQHYITHHDRAAAYTHAYGPQADGADIAARGQAVLNGKRMRRVLSSIYQRRALVTEVTLERTIRELARLAFIDPRELLNDDGTPRALSELSDDVAAAIAGLELVEIGEGAALVRKVKLPDKIAALRELATLCGWRVKKTEDVSRGGTLVIEGLNDPDEDDPLFL